MNSDFKDMLKNLNAFNVKYLIVGGYAVMFHGEPRYTGDMDFWIAISPENATAIFQALKTFGAPLQGLSEQDFMKPEYVYQMGRPPVRIDVLTSIDGVAFDAAWNDRVTIDYDGVPATMISKQDLIRNKQATGRPQDMVDVENLMAHTDPEGD